MGGCLIISKVVIIVINAIFALVGLALTALGIVCLIAFDSVVGMVSNVGFIKTILEMLEENGGVDLIKNSAISLLCLGIFLLVLALFGLCGAVKSVKCLLVIFIVLVGLILVVEIALIIYAVVDRDGIQSNVDEAVKLTIPKYSGAGLHYTNGTLIVADKESDLFSFAWDYVHIAAKCCGVNGTADWEATFNVSYVLPNGLPPVNAKFPLSCCQTDHGSRYPADVPKMEFNNPETCLTSGSEAFTNTKGCVANIFDEIWKLGTIAVGTIGGIIGIQFIEIICALCLIRGPLEGEIV